MRRLTPAVLLTLGFAVLYTATFDAEIGAPDERARVEIALRVAAHGPAALAGSGPVSRYPPLASLAAALAAIPGLHLDGGSAGAWTYRFMLATSLLACVALIPIFHRIAFLLALAPGRAAAATALFGLSNPLWPYSKRLYSEPISALLVLASFAGVLAFVKTKRRASLFAGLACCALLPLNNMNSVPPLALALAAMLWFAGEKKAIAGLAAALLAGALLHGADAWIRLGSPFATGYGREGFTFHTFEGLHGLLASPGRSVFVYAPILLLALPGLPMLWRTSRAAAAGVAAGTLAMLLLIASWWGWWGGICWGPRLMLPMMPVAAVGALGFLSRSRRRGRWAVALVALASLYVQTLGVGFKQDFDVYFWMKPDYSDERLAWFDWRHAAVVRMPRHFRDHPWDMSSAFLSLEQAGPSTVEIGRPVRRVEIVQRGDALLAPWSITDLYAVVARDGGEERIPAGKLGASLDTFNGRNGSGALDGNPATRWDTGGKRLDGMWVRLVLPETRRDLVRMELEHMPHARDFPYGLEARVDDGSGWTPVHARAAVPRLRWHPAIFALALAAVLLIVVGLRRAVRGVLRSRTME